MHHDQQQLDQLWESLKNGEPALRAELLQRYANSHMPGVAPEVVRDDADGQVLSVPTPDHPGRHLYGRKPGGRWTELR
jgi:hypothetical protein